MSRPSGSTINFEHVTLTMIFDLLLKIFNIGRNFFILRNRAFMFGTCVPYDKAFSDSSINFECGTLNIAPANLHNALRGPP